MAQETGGLPELLDALRWRWKLLLLVMVPILLGVALYVHRLPDQFEGQSVVALVPQPGESATEVVTVAGPRYVAYITAPATLDRLAKVLGVLPATLRGAVTATLASSTGDITLTAKLGSPQKASRVANALADELVAFGQGDPVVTPQLVAPAVVPSAPSGPPRKLMLAAGFLVALLLGVVAALVVERSRPRVRSWRDVAVLTGYPVLGRLPRARVLRRSSPARALSNPSVGGAVRSLRTNLERELDGRIGGVVVVTSAATGEGKTTVAAVLATSLARIDLRVLLVDADLRRAGLTRLVRGAKPGGLSGVLRGSDPMDAIQTGWISGLSLLPGEPDPEGGDLLARRFADVASQLRAAFDVVVVDSPALLGTDDAATLATAADGVLLVVSDGGMAAPVSEAVLTLHGLRVRVWGVVANRVRERSGTVSYAPASIGRS